jgi:cytochrome c553
MKRISRRSFLGASGAGLGALVTGSFAGCAAAVKGDLVPRSGRRVVVIGGGWGGATAAARGKASAADCVVCHGAHGLGDSAKLVPALAGQPPGYLRTQLQLFKHDQRSPGDPALRSQKTLIQAIPDDTLGDLAAYYSSLR